MSVLPKKGGVDPKPLLDVVGPDAFPAARDPENWTFKTDAEIAAIPDDSFVAPYSDPKLRSRSEMLKLVRLLHAAGVVGFRASARFKVGAFTVCKKDDLLRLVIDCRTTNQYHREPPSTHLSTVSALDALDLSDGYLQVNSHPQPLELSFSAIDLVDSFYQLSFEELASCWAFDLAVQAREFAVTQVWDDSSRSWRPVHPDEWLYPVMRVLPMGWSWSLWFCHSALREAMVVSEMKRVGESRAEVEARVVCDHGPSAKLAPRRPLLAPYVDNANIIAWTQADAIEAAEALASELTHRGFKFRVEALGARSMI